jgi:hypothetical protein
VEYGEAEEAAGAARATESGENDLNDNSEFKKLLDIQGNQSTR